LSDKSGSLARMTRGSSLQRSDIQKHSRRGVITLSYAGRNRKRVARLHGQDEDTLFVLNEAVVPLPDDVEELAQQVGVTLIGSPTETQFRRLVAEALLAEAIEKAPEHLLAITGVSFEWPDSTLVTLERDTKAAEARLDALIREVTARLKSKLVQARALPVFDWMPTPAERREPARPERAVAVLPLRLNSERVVTAPPAGQEMAHLAEAFVAARATPVAASVEPQVSPGASEAVLLKIRDATRAARDRDTPQRLPAGARKAVEASPPGALVWANGKANVCRSIEDAIGGARAVAVRGVDSAVIDWDGEQPVLVRRFTAGGITAYRCEDSIRVTRVEAAEEADAATLPAEEPTP